MAEAKVEAARQAEATLVASKAEAELAISRHLAFIDQLLADKAELGRQCEGLGAQVRAVEDKYAAAETAREWFTSSVVTVLVVP